MTENDRTRKIMVLTFNRADYALLEELLAAARQKIPDLDMDSAVSSILTEALKHVRATQPHTPIPAAALREDGIGTHHL